MLSDPLATPAALAAAQRLRSQVGTGRLLSGVWVSTTNWSGSGPAQVMPDFQRQYVAHYAASGGATGSGFPFILGVEDFIPNPGQWLPAYQSMLIPHGRAGGLAAILFVPTGYSTSYGPNNAGWPVMGKGTGSTINSTWFQGLAQTSSSFAISAATGFTNGTGTIPCAKAGTNFPTRGTLLVTTAAGYAIVTYTGINASGTNFVGCTCVSPGSDVAAGADVVDYTLLMPGTTQNAALNACLDDLVAQLVFLDSHNLAALVRILWEPNQPKASTVAWFVGTPVSYYQLVWKYFWNYVTGTAASLPVGGADASLVTAPQAVVTTGTTWAGNPKRPVHNALWMATLLGGKNSFGAGDVVAPAGYVDVAGFDFFTTNPATWNTLQSTPGGQWLKAVEYYWGSDPQNAIVGFSETGLKAAGGTATAWNAAFAQYPTASPPHGPSFFISWSDQGSTQNSIKTYSPVTHPDFATFWNSGNLTNLKPGAWPMAPQSSVRLVF